MKSACSARPTCVGSYQNWSVTLEAVPLHQAAWYTKSFVVRYSQGMRFVAASAGCQIANDLEARHDPHPCTATFLVRADVPAKPFRATPGGLGTAKIIAAHARSTRAIGLNGTLKSELLPHRWRPGHSGPVRGLHCAAAGGPLLHG
jgi:hypothetical protein